MRCATHPFRWKLYYIVLYENKLHVTAWLAFGVDQNTIVLHSYFDRIADGGESGCSIFDRWGDGNEMHSLHYVIYEFTFVY